MAIICLQEAHDKQPCQDDITQKVIQDILSDIEGHQRSVEQALYQATQAAYAELMELVTSVKGIGKEVATVPQRLLYLSSLQAFLAFQMLNR